MARKIFVSCLLFLTSISLAVAKQQRVFVKKPQKIEIRTNQPAITLATSNTNLPPLVAASIKMDTVAAQAIVVDHHTGRVILEKNADELVYPSSMTKIMTAYLIFDHLKKGSLQLDTPIRVSEKAWRMGGSKTFVKANSYVKVYDLLHGLIVQSGNDACVALAEGISGDEEIFAAEMTQRAHEFGATRTTFKNASGWPDPEHLTTMRDLSLIAKRVIDDHPEYYHLFRKKEFKYNNINQPNRNPLLYHNVGCDGLKTGFTDIGQYSLAASAKEIEPDGTEKRFNVIVNGLPSKRARAEESAKLMNWAMKNFASMRLLQAGQIVEAAPVWLGTEKTIPLTIANDCRITIPQAAKNDVKVEIIYDRPLRAPLKKGQKVGKVAVTAPTLEPTLELPLITAAEIKKAGLFKRLGNYFSYLIWGEV